MWARRVTAILPESGRQPRFYSLPISTLDRVATIMGKHGQNFRHSKSLANLTKDSVMTQFPMSKETESLFSPLIVDVISQARQAEFVILRTLASVDEANSRPDNMIGTPLAHPDFQRMVKVKKNDRKLKDISLRDAVGLLQKELSNWTNKGPIAKLSETLDSLKSGDPDLITLRDICAHGWWSEPGYDVGSSFKAAIEGRKQRPSSVIVVDNPKRGQFEVSAEDLSVAALHFERLRRQVDSFYGAIHDMWSGNG